MSTNTNARSGWTALAVVTVLAASGLLLGLGGCSKNDIAAPVGAAMERMAGASNFQDAEPAGGDGIFQRGTDPPALSATVSFAGQDLHLWPYTGNSFDGTPSDPVNLIFVGHVDPVRLRAALLALDGNRTAYGLPDAYPLNATWTDATGDVQTTYADGEGWVGSVIQLQLGSYDPLRVHLRFFRTGHPFAGGGQWTVGAAHLEVLIPGTADHAVLSWEVAEQLVAVDMMRTGLLAAPPTPSGLINQAPSFRDIPDYIYNELPPDLIALIQGPPQPVSGPVPIGSDGQATIFHVGTAAPFTAGPATQDFTLNYGIIMPRPLCSQGPTDWVKVEGPVAFHKDVYVDEAGRVQFTARFQGNLTATPMDITQNPPVPAGEPVNVVVNESQSGLLEQVQQHARVHSRRLLPGAGGTQFQQVELAVATQGQNSYRLRVRCGE